MVRLHFIELTQTADSLFRLPRLCYGYDAILVGKIATSKQWA